MSDRLPAVYMMANKLSGTIYTGVTSNLPQRAWQHREGIMQGFTTQHECKLLVWFERYDDMEQAIVREKRIKGGSRIKKVRLIEAMNPEWRDLFEDICQ